MQDMETVTLKLLDRLEKYQDKCEAIRLTYLPDASKGKHYMDGGVENNLHYKIQVSTLPENQHEAKSILEEIVDELDVYIEESPKLANEQEVGLVSYQIEIKIK